jgi:hypothetical protein
VSRDVADVGSELGYKIKVIELAGGAFVPFLLESICERLMIREYDEVTSFQHVSEMFHGLINSQQFAIVGAVFLLFWSEFFGEEGKGLPSSVDTLLEYGTQSRSGGVSDESQRRGRVGMRQ